MGALNTEKVKHSLHGKRLFGTAKQWYPWFTWTCGVCAAEMYGFIYMFYILIIKLILLLIEPNNAGTPATRKAKKEQLLLLFTD